MEDYIHINVNPQAASILCCKCGTSIEPNAANMCVACVRTEVDISEGIPKQCTLHFCKGCERYLQPPNQWVQCTLESRELLTLCLKKLKTLNRVRLVDATFAWTEPHSKRIKLKLTIQKEVLHGAILQQVFIVEFVVNSQMCEDCHRVEAKDFWRAVVQVRQKVLHKKTFYYLEQRILKHKAHVNALNIKANYDGLDFYFASKDHGRKLVDFLSTVAPCRYATAQQLVSHDVHSNVFNYKTTFSVEIAPICKDDLVCLPLKLARSLGSINQLCICARVTNCIHLIDPKTGQTVEITSNQFWRDPFVSIGHTKQYSEYVVMNTETLMSDENKSFAGRGQVSRKHVIADAWVVKANELGINENYDHCRTHLGHLIKPGDSVLGFDLACANVNNPHFEKLKAESVPDAIIIKKVYADKELRQRKRKWMLKHLNDETAVDSDEMHKDYVDFLEDLEEDPLYRKDVDVYKDPTKIGDESDYEDDTPRINLHEMLEDLHLDDPEAEGDDIDMTE